MSRADTFCACPQFKHFCAWIEIFFWIYQWGTAFGCRRAWFVRGFCSFCLLVWSVRSAVRILSCWAAMRGAVNIELLKRSVLLLEWMRMRMSQSLQMLLLVFVSWSAAVVDFARVTEDWRCIKGAVELFWVWMINFVADLSDAVLTDQESGDVGDPLMAFGVPSPQPEDHCFPDIKKGINLPKSEEQWLTANEYFKSILSLNPLITVQNLRSCVKLLNDTVYDNFSVNFGQVAQAPDESLIRKYEGKSKNDLKKSL